MHMEALPSALDQWKRTDALPYNFISSTAGVSEGDLGVSVSVFSAAQSVGPLRRS